MDTLDTLAAQAARVNAQAGPLGRCEWQIDSPELTLIQGLAEAVRVCPHRQQLPEGTVFSCHAKQIADEAFCPSSNVTKEYEGVFWIHN